MNLMQEAPNVVSDEGLRLLFAEGHSVDVVCRAEPQRVRERWTGLWTVHCTSPDKNETRLLVTIRNNMAPREFKTINGLFSYLHGLGITKISVPMEPAETTSHIASPLRT